jgi:integrase
MKKFNAENERIKRIYVRRLREALGYSVQSVDVASKAIASFEEYTRWKSFKAFHIDQAIAFKRHLEQRIAQRSGERLSKATLRQTLAALKAFFEWLSEQPGYKSRIAYSDAAYFSLSLKDDAIARAVRDVRFPTLEQMHHVLACMPTATEIDRRNRALIAYALLTIARADAIASVRLGHIDLEAGTVLQDARNVRTKFSKTIPTTFFPVGGQAREILEDWIKYLRTEKLWSVDDPAFPATAVKPGASLHFEVTGLDRKCWKGSAAVRRIFRDAFEGAGLPYFNPHSLRHTITQLGERVCRTPEQFKAWSQNMAHEGVMTTFRSYGSVAPDRQREIIKSLGNAKQEESEIRKLADEVAAMRALLPIKA